ncbi:MAG: apolipoprotein N-acyltransferase [Chitinophagaceae bacterium]
MKKLHPLLLALPGGLLLWAGWPVSPLTFLIFIAFVPFFWMEYTTSSRVKFLFYTYLMLMIWNTCTTWWMCNSTFPGGVAAILANSFLMSIPCLGFYNVKKRLGERIGYLAFIVFWLAFEYIHLNWQLSWPWLTLGNVFASHPDWVQWYQYTGTSAGSLWILVVNVLLFLILRKSLEPATSLKFKLPLAAFLVLFFPLLVSYFIKPATTYAKSIQNNIVVVQPNIDPYGKFDAGNVEGQLQSLLTLSLSAIDSNTAIVVWPETAISFPGGIDEARIREHKFLVPVWDFLRKHPRIKLLSGIESYRLYTAQDKTASARQIEGSDNYYDSFNAAGLFDSSGALQLYHKSKLVPGVETLPTYLRFLDKWFESFGGTTGGYASQVERTVLTDPASGYKFAPAICYESIYGEFMTEYICNGANVIAVITNDGWWENTAGYKQHMQYARLRAIETRRWIVRSANTGISCFITPSGEVLEAQPWDKAATIKMSIPQNQSLTFFVEHGDILSIIAESVAVFLLFMSLITWARNRFFK